ncbi:hypothetical protein J2T56_002700 [Natronobacillus azotifigens]|uniref:Uncharacterized protein n=1 Tax=Natronobacillus azotifigens TaxID=472978 RepID=A0A9J6RGA5_9BACI|nr:hypothetical protein [Natronobacillus azotifigens]MCZ0704363.1 hypothetical protein [Natronobacillus azotifigens]
MFKPITVYVKNENDAEDLKAKLKRFKTNDLLVDQIQDKDDLDLIAPPPPHEGHDGVYANISPQVPIYGDSEEILENEERNSILTGEVADEDFQEALNVIREEGGYIDRGTID